jgi:hypothetical protein
LRWSGNLWDLCDRERGSWHWQREVNYRPVSCLLSLSRSASDACHCEEVAEKSLHLLLASNNLSSHLSADRKSLSSAMAFLEQSAGERPVAARLGLFQSIMKYYWHERPAAHASRPADVEENPVRAREKTLLTQLGAPRAPVVKWQHACVWLIWEVERGFALGAPLAESLSGASAFARRLALLKWRCLVTRSRFMCAHRRPSLPAAPALSESDLPPSSPLLLLLLVRPRGPAAAATIRIDRPRKFYIFILAPAPMLLTARFILRF